VFSDSALAANSVSAAGVQFLDSFGQVGDTFGEDCLTVNVWTKPQVGEVKKAVLVWIMVMGFTIGNSDNAGNNGQYLAEREDFVVVSLK
jgi:carboxylesterase type B